MFEGKFYIDKKNMDVDLYLLFKKDYGKFVKEFLELLGEDECTLSIKLYEEEKDKRIIPIMKEDYASYKEELSFLSKFGVKFRKDLTCPIKTNIVDKVVDELVSYDFGGWLEYFVVTKDIRIQQHHEGFFVFEPKIKTEKNLEKIINTIKILLFKQHS